MRGFVQRTHTDPNTGFDINNKPVDLPSQPSKIDPNAKSALKAAFFQTALSASVYAAGALVRRGRALNRSIRGSALLLRASDI